MKMYKDRSDVYPAEREMTELKVYINSNVKEIPILDDEEQRTEYEFDVQEYSKDEYIALLDEQLTDTQLALVELYEGMA